MANVLIVGGAGYIGNSIVDEFLKTTSSLAGNNSIKVYDNLLYQDNYFRAVDFVYGDIRDKVKLKKELDWADIVIWLAAIVGDQACCLNPRETIEINEISLFWLTKNFKKRIIFLSTCSIYGLQYGVLKEDALVNPLSLYAGTKLNAERALLANDSLIFRLGTVYGIAQTFGRVRFDLVVNVMTASAYCSKKLVVNGGEQYRPVIHVRDVASMVVKGALSKNIGVYNLSSANIKILDLANMVAEEIPETAIDVVSQQFEDSRNYQVNCEKAITELGFKPEFGIKDGIREVVKLLGSGRIKDYRCPIYSNQAYLDKIQYQEKE